MRHGWPGRSSAFIVSRVLVLRVLVLRVLVLYVLVLYVLVPCVLGVSAESSAPPCALAQPVASSPGGANRTLDEVLAVVGDTPILRSEFETQFETARVQFRLDPADTASTQRLRREILSRLIDDELVLQAAKAQAIDVTLEEIGPQVEQLLQEAISSTGGREGFEAQLRQEGLTEAGLRTQYTDQVRRQAIASKWIQRECRPKSEVTDVEIQKFYDENRTELPERPRTLHVQDVFIMVRPDSVLEARTRDRAADVQRLIIGGLDFAQAARDHSDADDADAGGELERFALTELDPIFGVAVKELGLGQVSPPVRSLFGYHLLLVRDRDPQGQWIDLSHILFELKPTRTDENRAIERAASIRRQIAGGQSTFEQAVERYSEDPDSKARGGDLGWIPSQGFYGAVKAVMDTLRVGRISEPVPADGGVHVFKLLGEEAERPYRFEEIRDDLGQMASRAAVEKQIRACLDELRKKHYVEIRTKL